MKAIYALYREGQSAQQAVNRLRAAGVADRDITVLSAYPMEAYDIGHMDRSTSLWWVACGGGLLGMAVGAGLAWLTQTAWPMNVGGLPTFAWWPFLIIIFELTMLGAILATVIGLVVTAGLGRRRALYDPEVSDGQILVGVEHPQERALPALEAALTTPPGARVKRV